eukprot:1683584-Rhodomonas_salina.2
MSAGCAGSGRDEVTPNKATHCHCCSVSLVRQGCSVIVKAIHRNVPTAHGVGSPAVVLPRNLRVEIGSRPRKGNQQPCRTWSLGSRFSRASADISISCTRTSRGMHHR